MKTKRSLDVAVGDQVRFAERGKIYTVVNRTGPYLDRRNTGKNFIRFNLWDVAGSCLTSRSVRTNSTVYQVDKGEPT